MTDEGSSQGSADADKWGVSRVTRLIQTLQGRGFDLWQVGEETGEEWNMRELYVLSTGYDVGAQPPPQRMKRTIARLEALVDGRRDPINPPAHPPITRGRPPVGAPRGESPVVKGRVTPSEFDSLKEVMAESGRSQSEVVRRGVQLAIQEHRALRDLAHATDKEIRRD